MEIKDSIKNIKKEYPDLYKSIIEKMKIKQVDTNKLEWYYSYCMMIDNSPDPTNLQDIINNYKTKFGISLEAKSGRKIESRLIKQNGITGNIPSIFLKMAHDSWDKINKENIKEKKLISNLDSVLKSVGKKGSAKNNKSKFKIGNGMDLLIYLNRIIKTKEPKYPTIKDIKNIRPDIYQNQLIKANGQNLVVYNPNNKEDCDEWGFYVIPVLLATQRNKEDRFIYDAIGFYYIIKDNILYYGGCLSGIDKALNANEGEKFVGWKRTKQYRLTKNEIELKIKSKIFKDGGVLI